MSNLIADLKLFISNSGESLILKHDFHIHDDFLNGYAIVDRDDIGAIIEFFASCDESQNDSFNDTYKDEQVGGFEILEALSIHSSSKRDVSDMRRIFGPTVGDCYWLDRIACFKDNLTISEDTYAATFTPELHHRGYPSFCFPFATLEAIDLLSGLGEYQDLSGSSALLGLVELPDGANKFLSRYASLDLSGLQAISGKAAEALSKCTELDLSGLKNISDQTAEGLAKRTEPGSTKRSRCQPEWWLFLGGLEAISPSAAELLVQRKSSLALSGLKEISGDVAKALSKCAGKLELCGLKSLSPQAAEFLARHEGSLNLGGLEEITDDAAKELAKHSGTLNLEGLFSLTDASAEALAKHDGPIQMYYDALDVFEKFRSACRPSAQ